MSNVIALRDEPMPGDVPRVLSDADQVTIIEGHIRRLLRQVNTLRARRAKLAPHLVKRTGPWRKAGLFEINGVDVPVSLRESMVLERLIACPEGDIVPLAEVWGFYDANPQWTRSALYKLNRKLEAAKAEVSCLRRRGYRLVNIVTDEEVGA